MFDDRPEIKARLDDALVAWLTTVNPKGQPQPSVVWFITTDDYFVIYSKDDTPRLRNIQADSHVSLNLNSDADGDDVLIIEARAEIIGKDVPPSADAAYVAKYERHLPRWDFTWQSYDEGFPVRVHIRPTGLRSHLSAPPGRAATP
ncbi:MAG: pyridoxamine 5'-phosphate oxidase family protein [Chloroflexota bacterium]